MRTELAIITTEFMRDFVNGALKKMDLDADISIHCYHNLSELPALYKTIPERIPGVITSGSVAAQIIKRLYPESRDRIIRAFNNDDAGIFKLFLDLIQENRNLNIRRIFADILDAAGIRLGDYLSAEQLTPYSARLEEQLERQDLPSLLAIEAHYISRHLKLWEAGRIDVSVTRFSSIVGTLTEAGLKVHFAYPSLAYVSMICTETIQQARLLSMRENQTAAIVVTPARSPEPERQREQLVELRRALLRFNKLHQLDFLVRLTDGGFEILTNRRAVSELTNDFRSCRLRPFLKDQVDFAVNVGYGLGESMRQALDNAMYANREAGQSGTGASCLINDRNEMVAPLSSTERLVFSRETTPKSRLASVRSGLSPLTVRKIIAALESMGEPRITSRDLAHKLSITKRSANRFLSALWESGLAEVVEVRHSTTKGRPERIYSIKVEELS